MSDRAVELLTQLAASEGVSKTQILEYSIARYAGEVGIDVEKAKLLLLEHFTGILKPSPSGKAHKKTCPLCNPVLEEMKKTNLPVAKPK